jgi:glucose-1-phosphate adenylyltransferase
MIHDTLALILAGGKANALGILEQKRTKAAIPFGGIYRLIDFTLSNLANAGIRRIGVLTQYRPASLIEHIYFGKPWDLIGRSRELRVLPPYIGDGPSSWYKGTADALFQNIDFIKTYKPNQTFVLSGENICKINFNDIYDYHISKKADITMVVKKIKEGDLSRFGIIGMDKNNKIISYEEKPEKPKTRYVSLTIYLFNNDILLKEITSDAKDKCSTHNFSYDLFPKLIKKYKTYAYVYDGPWFYVGNIDEYWQTNMNMLDLNPKIQPEEWGVRTNIDDRMTADRMPAHIDCNDNIKNSIVTRGCSVEGKVINSVLFPGVVVKKNAVIKDSIIMHDSFIDENCVVEKSIFDKDVVLGKNVLIGCGENISNIKYPQYYNSGITVIGKGVNIPSGVKIGKNCLIYDGAKAKSFRDKNIASGTSIYSV